MQVWVPGQAVQVAAQQALAHVAVVEALVVVERSDRLVAHRSSVRVVTVP